MLVMADIETNLFLFRATSRAGARSSRAGAGRSRIARARHFCKFYCVFGNKNCLNCCFFKIKKIVVF